MLPKRLQSGDTIGIIAPSKAFTEDKKIEFETFIEYLNEQGLKVKISKNFYAKDIYGAAAGTPQQRAEDINSMFADKNVKAVWGFQGGDNANQTLDLIDFDIIKNNPKILLGKSDIDVLLLAFNKKTGLITFHTCDAKIGSNKEMDFDYTKKWFEKRLFQGSKEFEPSEEWTCINDGVAKGKIIGCNPISMLKLAGTPYFPVFTDAILFIESIKSTPKELLWQIAQFEQIGVFNKIKGIVVGHNFEFSDKKHPVEQIIKEQLAKYDLPILKINEFGHYQPHAFLPIGARIKLDATNKKITILDDFIE